MSIAFNIIGGIIAGLLSAVVYGWIRRPRLDIALLPQLSLRATKDSTVATQEIRVTNVHPCSLLRKFLRRSDAHSCFAWVMLCKKAPLGKGAFGMGEYSLADWIPVYQHPSTIDSKSEHMIPSNKTEGQFIDIANGVAADISIVKKAIGESACYILPWEPELQIGEYILKIELGCSGLPRISKWYLLENKGVAKTPNDLAESFALKELTEKAAKEFYIGK